MASTYVPSRLTLADVEECHRLAEIEVGLREPDRLPPRFPKLWRDDPPCDDGLVVS